MQKHCNLKMVTFVGCDWNGTLGRDGIYRGLFRIDGWIKGTRFISYHTKSRDVIKFMSECRDKKICIIGKWRTPDEFAVSAVNYSEAGSVYA
jgi:hypothetical protein